MTASLRAMIAGPAQGAALRFGLSAWLARRRRARSVIMLHGVGGPGMRAENFRALIGWLRDNFEIVSTAQMLRELREGRPPDSRGEVAITFDDGLDNQFRFAYPILQAFNVPATMFVCPGLIDRGEWIWNMAVRARLSRLDLSAQQRLARDLGMDGCRGSECIVAWMKTLPLAQRQQAEAMVAAATPDFVPTPEEIAANQPLSWEQVRAMDPKLITIGSHTSNHPILPTLDDAAIRAELEGSRDALQAQLQRPVEQFCYPNGSHDERVRRWVAQTYAAAFAAEEGLVQPGQDLFCLKRIPASGDPALTAWRLHRPQA